MKYWNIGNIISQLIRIEVSMSPSKYAPVYTYFFKDWILINQAGQMKVMNRHNNMYKMAATVENVHSNMLVRIMSRNVNHACDFGICFYNEKYISNLVIYKYNSTTGEMHTNPYKKYLIDNATSLQAWYIIMIIKEL